MIKSRKKGRGGARKDAGRKKVITDLSWIDIGIMCERLQTEDAERAAVAKYEQLDRTKRIRGVQKSVVRHRITDQRKIDERWVQAGLSDMIQDRPDVIKKPTPRAVSLKVRRVATRGEIYTRVSDALVRMGRRRITPNQVRDAWYRYHRLLVLKGGREGVASDAEILDVLAALDRN
jgi:hypothetical protein